MSKNLTLKGLALGAVIALGSSFLAGAPANAAIANGPEVITLAANAGTTNNTLIGASFAVANNVDQALETQYGKKAEKIAYLVENSSASKIKISLDAATGDGNIGAISADATADYAGSYELDAADTGFTAKKFVTVKATLNDQTVDTVDVGKNVLTITSTIDTTDNFSVKVTAFVDENGNGKLDAATDYASTPYTINFVARANVTVTTSLVSAVVGATAIQAKTVIGNDINNESLAGQVRFGFTKNGTALKINNTTTYDTIDAAWSDSVLKNTTTRVASLDNVDTIPADNTIVAQAYLGLTSGSGATAVYTKLGSASNAVSSAVGSAATASIDHLDVLAVTENTSVYASSATVTQVKTGSTAAVAFSSQLESVDNTDVKLKDQTVKVTLTKGATFAAASTFTVGANVLTATSGPVSFNVLTDADGAVAFSGAHNAGTKGDIVEVKIEALKNTGFTAAKINTLTWTDADAEAIVETSVKGASDSSLKIARGASFTLDYAVVDQFGGLFTKTGYQVVITENGSAAFSFYPALVGGKVSQAIVDNATGDESYTVNAELQKLTGTTWAQYKSLEVDRVVVTNTKVASTVSATATSATVDTIAKTLVSADLRVDTFNSGTAIGYEGTAATVTGTVADATGAGVAGQAVTVSGTGLGFVSEDGKIYAVGSITVNADASGYYAVSVFSTAAGKKTLTVTAGSATKTATITFAGITALAETNVLTIDAPALTQVGRAVTVTVKLVDKYGNVVDTAADKIALSVTGVGSLSASKGETDDTGLLKFQFVAGANDFGDAVITAKYTATNAAETVVSASKTVTVGITDAQIDVVGKRVTAVASFSKGKTVAFYVNGEKKWSKLSASDADVVLYYNLKKGRNTVTVKISGGFVTTDIIVVK